MTYAGRLGTRASSADGMRSHSGSFARRSPGTRFCLSCQSHGSPTSVRNLPTQMATKVAKIRT